MTIREKDMSAFLSFKNGGFQFDNETYTLAFNEKILVFVSSKVEPSILFFDLKYVTAKSKSS